VTRVTLDRGGAARFGDRHPWVIGVVGALIVMAFAYYDAQKLWGSPDRGSGTGTWAGAVIIGAAAAVLPAMSWIWYAMRRWPRRAGPVMTVWMVVTAASLLAALGSTHAWTKRGPAPEISGVYRDGALAYELVSVLSIALFVAIALTRLADHPLRGRPPA